MKTNLKQARKIAGYTQEEVANRTGIALGTLRRWEQGVNEPDMGSIIQLAKFYNTSTDVILGSDFSTASASNESHYVDIPLYGSIAAGTPLEMLPVDDTYPAPRQIIKKYPGSFWLRIASDSMDLMFPVGTLVLVNPMDDIRQNGKPYALCVNGYDATVKLVDKLSNGYKLTPASTDPTYKAKVYDYSVPDTDRITVIGEIVYDMKPFDWSY